jgi:hypothetical protein
MPAPDFSKGVAFMRGQYVPIGEASIPMTDWGFLRSDATYDVVTVWDGAATCSPWQMSRTFSLTRSQPRSLLSRPRSNSQLACAVLQLQAHPDGPDILELEGCFLTNEFALVPRLALGLIAGSFHFELLKS